MCEEVGEGTPLLVLAVAQPCQTLSMLGGSPTPPCPGPQGSPRATQPSWASTAPPRFRQHSRASRHRNGSSSVSPTCGAPSRGAAPQGPALCRRSVWGHCWRQRDRPRSLGSGYRKAWGPWVTPRGPRDVPWVAPGGRGASRLRFSGGSGAGPARSCGAPDVRHRHKDGRGSSHLSGPCVPRSPHAHVPRSHCPCISMATAPFVPKFPRSGVLVSRCLRFPGSLCPQVPAFPDPFVPSFPVSPRVPGHRGMLPAGLAPGTGGGVSRWEVGGGHRVMSGGSFGGSSRCSQGPGAAVPPGTDRGRRGRGRSRLPRDG